MTQKSKNPDVLVAVVARVLEVGAVEFEVEYKDSEDHVFAINGALGVGVAAFPSNSKDGQELRRQLHAAKRKCPKITCAGVEYNLRVQIYESFGEDAFRVVIATSKRGADSD